MWSYLAGTAAQKVAHRLVLSVCTVHTSLRRLKETDQRILFTTSCMEWQVGSIGSSGVSELAYSLSPLSWRIQVGYQTGFSSLSVLFSTSSIWIFVKNTMICWRTACSRDLEGSWRVWEITSCLGSTLRLANHSLHTWSSMSSPCEWSDTRSPIILR